MLAWEYKRDSERKERRRERERAGSRPYTRASGESSRQVKRDGAREHEHEDDMAGERGRSMAPTCQNVPLEFKCILFNGQKKPGAPGVRRL